MRPLIFDYVKNQKQSTFPNLKYNEELHLNMLNNEIFITGEDDSTILASKTKTARESDDETMPNEHSILLGLTKTDTLRETDDDYNNNPSLSILQLLTKTEQNREQDE